LCGINCLGEYGVSGCELRNNECFVVKENTQLANPASVKCVEDGGTVKILTESEGQRGICLFSDGSVCDEWAYFRGECSQGDCMKKCGAIGTRSEGWYDCNGNLLYWDNCASQEFDCTPYAGSNACTMDYNPVCAEIQADGGNFFETFGNLCGACTSGNNILSLRRGECPEDALMRESTPV
jgi:putative hemolysin